MFLKAVALKGNSLFWNVSVTVKIYLVWVDRCNFHGPQATFLVACYATLHPAMSVGLSAGHLVGWSVGRMVGRLVGWLGGRSLFYFFGVFELFGHKAPAQMP